MPNNFLQNFLKRFEQEKDTQQQRNHLALECLIEEKVISKLMKLLMAMVYKRLSSDKKLIEQVDP
jgi:hypothetical protein